MELTEAQQDQESLKYSQIQGYQTKGGVICPDCARKMWGFDAYLNEARYPHEIRNGYQILPVYGCDDLDGDETCPKCNVQIREEE